MYKKVKRGFSQKIMDAIVFVLLSIIFIISRIVPMCILATIFGILAVIICPIIPANKLVVKNLKNRMSELNFYQRMKIMFGVWYNLGRFLGEYPYVYTLKKNHVFKYIKIGERSRKILEEIKNNKSGCIIFSGHISNWEFGLRALNDLGLKTSAIFREVNNFLVEKYYSSKIRKKCGINMIAKSDNAGIKSVRSIKNGNSLVILSDQREKKHGTLINFFGKKAYTPRSIYVMAKKLNVPVYGIRVIRCGLFSNFMLEIEDKFYVNEHETEQYILQKVNNTLEKWIREYPSQWFWVHNRWK